MFWHAVWHADLFLSVPHGMLPDTLNSFSMIWKPLREVVRNPRPLFGQFPSFFPPPPLLFGPGKSASWNAGNRRSVAGLDKQASILTQFVDYILSENSNKFRDGEPFLSTGALKASWDAFFGARPQAELGGRSHNKNFKEKGSAKKPEVGPARFLNICFAWNKGLCLKSAGSCTSKRGTPLKHIWNFLPDLSKPDQVCGKDHQCKDFHK